MSLKVVPFESLGTVSYSPSIVTMAVSVAVCEIFNRVRVRSRLLEMAPFDRSHTSSCSPSIVTMAISLAICEIFRVNKWRDLKNQIRGRSRSININDRPLCDFLVVSYCKYSSILYHSQVT